MARSRAVRGLCLSIIAGLLLETAGSAVDGGGSGPAAGGTQVAKPAPGQRWGGAAGLDHLVPGPVNRTLPVSQRGRYPRRATPAAPSNVATAEIGPVAARTGFDRATSRELPEARGAFERVYTNADGTQTTEFSGLPANYKAQRGRWAPIDTRLSPMDGGGWRNDTNSARLRFAPRADAAELASVRLDDESTMAYGLAEAAPVAGTAEGSTVTYAGVRPGVDLRLEARPGGVKETLVLHGPDAPRSFVFPLRLTGLTPSLVGGQLLLTDKTGTQRAVVPPGDMVDAAGALSTGVTYRLMQGALELTADSAWLRDPARRYPVLVDPTVSLPVDSAAADSSMYVRGGSSSSGSSELQAGDLGGVNTASYLKFGSLVGRLRNHTIYGAQLQVVNYDASSCRARPVTVHPVTQSWSAGGGHSYPGPSVGGSLASRSFAHGYVAFGQSRSSCPTAAELFDLGGDGVRVVQRWVDGDTPNNGLSLRANVSDSLSGKRFAGSGTANPPKLFITHSPYNASYSIPNPVPNPPVLQNQDGRVKVTVTNRSAEAWAPGGYYLAYRVYNSRTGAAAGQYRAANLSTTVSRGAKVTLDATIKALPPGTYFLDFTMVRTGGVVFTDHQVPPGRIVLQIIDIPPVVQELYPPNGYQAPTLTPLLWGRALDIDAPPGVHLSYKFEVCERTATNSPANCFNSGYQASPAWTVPSGRLRWSMTYLWRVFVKDAGNEVASPYSAVLAQVPQPELTSRIAGATQAAQEREFDAQSGNFSTVAVDATVTTAGPELNLVRTYNSLDPRRDGAFGAGWSTRYDMRLVADNDGSGNIVVTYPDGQAVRFGRNPDGSYAAPAGRTAGLTPEAHGFTLRDRAGMVYQFSPSGRLTKITDAAFRSVVLTYNTADGRLARAQVSNSQTNTAGRSLRFTWSGAHVSAVTNDLNDSWTYTYTGDTLTSACAPGGACTRYAHGPGSHYRSAVLDSRAESYWRLGETQGTAAGSEIAVNLGEDAGSYVDVALGTPGALAGPGGTAASFNGTSSRVDIPKGLLKKSRDTAVELWFRANPTGSGGPLLGYQDKAFGTAPGRGVPVLYVGADGRLRGQFGTGSIAPIASPHAVTDGRWHHAVLSAMGTTQTLFLDGAQVGQLTGDIDHTLLTFNQIGAASVSTPAAWPQWGTGAQRSFNGAIDEVAVYSHPLGSASVAAHYRYGTTIADQVTTVTLPSGAVSAQVSYDVGLDRVAGYTDRDGGTWKVGAPTVYGGDADLRRGVQVLDPGNRPHLFEYDALTGQLLRSGTPLGLELREEDRPGEPAPPPPPPVEHCGAPDPNDPAFCTTIPGSAGGPVFVRHPLDGMAIRTFQYDDRGNQSVVTNENGDSVTMTHDDRGNVTSRKTCRAANQCQTSYTSYPATVTNPFDPRNELPTQARDGRSASATDPTFLTRYSYTPAGELATQIEPDGSTVTHTYTTGGEGAVGGGTMPPGLVLSTTDARGKPTRYAYHANGDLARVTQPSGHTATYTYDALGRTVTETSVSDSFPSGVTTTFGYDALSRPTSTTEPVTTDAVSGTRHQRETVTSYDVDGNVTRVDINDKLGGDPTRSTTWDYDEHGRPIRVSDAEGNETTTSYDRFGNKMSTVDANGNRYDFAYTARNSVAEVRLRAYTSDTRGGLVGDYLVLHSYSYDFAGRMASDTDAMGRRLEFKYWGDDLLRTITLKNFHDQNGSTRDYVVEDNTYDGAGNLTRQLTANGTRVLQQTFDRVGNVATAVEDPGGLGRTTAYGYDGNGNVTRISRSGKASNVPWPMSATPEVVDYAYDDAGNAIRETVTAGGTALVTTSAYDQRGLLIASTDPRGNLPGADPVSYTTNFGHDELGRQVTERGPPVVVETAGQAARTLRPVSTVGFNTFDEQVALTDEVGNVRRWGYDRAGRTVARSEPAYRAPGAPNLITPTTRMRYDALGQLIEETDPRGSVTRYGYDQLNRLVTKDEPAATNDERAVWRYEYTRTGELLATTDPLGGRVESTYDDLDREITATRLERKPVAANLTTRTGYDDAGNITQITSPSGAITRHAYDALDQLIATTDPSRVVTQFGYDHAGRRVRLSDPVGHTQQIGYDEAGRMTVEADLRPDGSPLRTERHDHDAAGNLIATTDSLGTTATYAYDADDRLVKRVEPVSAGVAITTTFGYDAAGNRTRYTNGRGHSTHYTFNSLGRPESVIEPATPVHPNAPERTWTAGYDAGGNPVKLVAPGGVSREAGYDAAGRLATETGAGAAVGTATRTRGHDLLGRLVSVSAPAGTNTYTYDDAGQLLTTRGPGGTADYAYDADGNVITRADAAGTSRFTYVDGRLATVTDGVTGTVARYGYDPAGRIETVGYGAGRTRSYGYDDLGRTGSDTVRNGSGQVVSSVTYRYNANDQVTGKTTAGTAGAGDNTYDYDKAGRLVSWTGPAGTTGYEWDEAGNRTRAGPKAARYDERNRLLSDGDYTYTHTARGTLESRTSAGLTEPFDFDAFDRMVAAGGQAYAYDGLDRLAARGGTTFGYAGLTDEVVADGAERYARGPDDELLAVGSGQDKTLTLSDEHGDVVGGIAAGDTALPELSDSTAYDPFGKVVTADGDTGNVGFQGDWTDPATGQVDMGARWYDPGKGAFESRDPAGYADGDTLLGNRYAYAAGDPVTLNDPSGFCPFNLCKKAKKVAGAVVGGVKRGAGAVWGGIKAGAGWAWGGIKAGAGWAWGGIKWAWSGIKKLAGWAWSGLKWIGRGISNGAKYIWRKAGQAWRSVSGWVSRGASWAAQKAAQARRAAYERAKRVTALARKAIAYAAKHTPLRTVVAALKPALSGLKKVVSAAASLPAKVVSTVRDVVADTVKAAKAIYHTAVEAAGTVVKAVSKAAGAVADFAQAAAPYLKTALKVAAEVTGVSDLVSCVTKGDLEACAWTAATIAGYLAGGGGGAAVRAARAARLAAKAGKHADDATDAVKGGRRVADEAGSCMSNSFTGETRVRMADGGTKPIGEVKVGDTVLATDPTTGRTSRRPVTQVISRHGDKDLVDVTVDAGVITATDSHPFWVGNERRWVEAGDLGSGQQVGTTTITGTRAYRERRQVFNLTVDTVHTYYVVAGNRDLLVHNDGFSVGCPVHRLDGKVSLRKDCNGMSDLCPDPSGRLRGRSPDPRETENTMEHARADRAAPGQAANLINRHVQQDELTGADPILGIALGARAAVQGIRWWWRHRRGR